MDICIYHGNCADGFGSAFAVYKKFGHQCAYYPGKYGEEPPYTLMHDCDVVIVDFSYKKEVMKKIIEIAKSVTVLDHHVTAQADLEELFEDSNYKISGIFDMERSGAVITWQYFHPDTKVPRLFQHIQDRDLWEFELTGTKEIQACVFSHEYDFDVWQSLVDMCEKNAYDLINDGEAIMRKQMKDIHEFMEATQHELVVGEQLVPALNAPYFWSSEAGHIMCVDKPFAACYWKSKKGWTFSLRSTDEGMDVSEIALMYGGGGHRNAAGFEIEHLHDL